MLSLATVVLTLLTASSALARPNPSPALFPMKRQTTLSGCASQCAAMQSDTAAGSNVASLCTSSVVSDYATCLNCEVAAAKAGPADAAAAEAQAAQQIMNALVSSCSAVNQPITGVNITGAGGSDSGSGSGTQTGSAGASTTGTGGTVAGGPAKTNGADALGSRTRLGVAGIRSLILGTVALLL